MGYTYLGIFMEVTHDHGIMIILGYIYIYTVNGYQVWQLKILELIWDFNGKHIYTQMMDFPFSCLIFHLANRNPQEDAFLLCETRMVFWCWLPLIFPGSQLSGIYRLGFLYVATEIDAHTWTANDPYFEGFDPQSGGLRHCTIWLNFYP